MPTLRETALPHHAAPADYLPGPHAAAMAAGIAEYRGTEVIGDDVGYTDDTMQYGQYTNTAAGWGDMPPAQQPEWLGQPQHGMHTTQEDQPHRPIHQPFSPLRRPPAAAAVRPVSGTFAVPPAETAVGYARVAVPERRGAHAAAEQPSVTVIPGVPLTRQSPVNTLTRLQQPPQDGTAIPRGPDGMPIIRAYHERPVDEPLRLDLETDDRGRRTWAEIRYAKELAEAQTAPLTGLEGKIVQGDRPEARSHRRPKGIIHRTARRLAYLTMTSAVIAAPLLYYTPSHAR